MQKKIAQTDSVLGLGHSYQSKLMRVASGPYLGRRVALFQSSNNEIRLSWSDSPATSWSAPQTVVPDASYESFDCRMDSDNNILLAYTDSATNYLTFRQLAFNNGQWTAGSPVVIYNGNPGFDPSLAVGPDGVIWLSWSRFISPVRRIDVKSSSDGGATWGTGPEDPGDEIQGTALFGWSRVLIDPNYVHVIYNDQNSSMSIKSRPVSEGSWSEAFIIATGTSFNAHFDAAVSADGRLGVVFSHNGLYYREYDGTVWQNTVTIDSGAAECPQLTFEQNVPVITYLSLFTGSQMIARCSNRRTGSFATPTALDNRAGVFDAVVLYEASSDSYQDLSVAAENDGVGDVFHSGSGCLLDQAGDAVYLGMSDRFRLCRLLLSTPGAGGGLQYSYWDGTSWQTFTPAGGSYDFSLVTTDILFWNDYFSIPGAWQKCVVNGQSLFWIRIEVSSAFTSGPVGSQITAVSQLSRLILRR